MDAPPDFSIPLLGPPRVPSPLRLRSREGRGGPHFVGERERILWDDCIDRLPAGGGVLPTLELAGPRRDLFFDPEETAFGIVTCGGLCPGLNDVIRGLVMLGFHRYGVRRFRGFRYGFRGLVPRYGHPVMELRPELVSDIHKEGGTLLGTSRGPQDTGEMVDTLERLDVDVLFVIGGDGTMRGALDLVAEVRRRGLAIGIVGVPKTIDNDLEHLDQSFGFETAYSLAEESIVGAHNEARGVPGGVGLVKLMGRHSGLLACHATLATSEVNFCLIPEVPFQLEGEGGLLEALRRRLEERGHAVIVAAEGAGQHLFDSDPGLDASGNRRLHDLGPFLAERIGAGLEARGVECSVKYIDPSYIVRSLPARPPDSVYCWRLAQHAVHAAMSGRTEMVVGLWHGRMVHVPMRLVASGGKRVDPEGDLWLSVLESTGQPSLTGSLD